MTSPTPATFFSETRLADVYDRIGSGDRDDLEAYVAIVEELGVQSILDLGSGTGTFACLLAGRGKSVTGVEPAAASVAVARRKPHAGRVRWIVGDATAIPAMNVDLVTMTGNVVEHMTDEQWTTTLRRCHAVVRPGGHLVFEVRRPGAFEAWARWDRASTLERVELDDVGPVEHWLEATRVTERDISFRWTFAFERDGAVFAWDATFRRRTEDEIREAVAAAGFTVQDVRDAPDRPGLEYVFVARRPAPTTAELRDG